MRKTDFTLLFFNIVLTEKSDFNLKLIIRLFNPIGPVVPLLRQFVRQSHQWLAGPTCCVCECEAVIFHSSVGTCSNSARQQQQKIRMMYARLCVSRPGRCLPASLVWASTAQLRSTRRRILIVCCSQLWNTPFFPQQLVYSSAKCQITCEMRNEIIKPFLPTHPGGGALPVLSRFLQRRE